MKVVVVGCGHVGLVTAAAFADIGHTVVGMDSDPHRLAELRSGRAPFYEPGLDDLVERHHGDLLGFEADAAVALDGADAAFICVSTPPRPDGRLSLAYVEQATRTIAEAASGPLVVVEKSTVPVQTARRIMDTLREAGRDDRIEVATNPEFTAEGRAVLDTLRPSRIVVGVNGSGRAESVLRDLYEPIVRATGCAFIVTDLDTAETIKHASNSFLATKISFINMVASLCEKVGADVDAVAAGMGLDPRIGPSFLRAGAGWGGSCFPKDVSQFIEQAGDHNLDFGLLREVRAINAAQRTRLLDKIRQAVWNVEGKTIGVWGLAFKPGTDDMREAAALEVLPALVAEGARVRAYDPAASNVAKELLPDVEIAADAAAAAAGADALVVLTEWDEFARADLAKLRSAMRRPVVVDGRNLFAPADMASHGFTYLSFGRPDVVAGEVKRA